MKKYISYWVGTEKVVSMLFMGQTYIDVQSHKCKNECLFQLVAHNNQPHSTTRELMADRELLWWLFVICFVPWMMTDYLRLPSFNIYFYRSMYTKMLDSRWCICLYTRMPLPRTNTTMILNGKIYEKWIVECITCQYIVHNLYNIGMNCISKYIILLVILHTRIASKYIILNL